MSIFSKLREKQAEQAVSDLQSYYNFLARVDIHNATDKQADQLQKHMQSVGKSIEQVEKDYQAVMDAKASLALIDDTADLSDEIEQLNQAHLDACAERQAQYQRCNELVRIATTNLDAARALLQRRHDAMNGIGQLRQSAPHVLAAIEPNNKTSR